MIAENETKPWEILTAKSENKVKFAYEMNEKVESITQPQQPKIQSV